MREEDYVTDTKGLLLKMGAEELAFKNALEELKDKINKIIPLLPTYLQDSLRIFLNSIIESVDNLRIARERFKSILNLTSEAALNTEGEEVIDGLKTPELREISSKRLRSKIPALNSTSVT